MNEIFQEDCRTTLRRLHGEVASVPYCFTVPPDFHELGMDPGKDCIEWTNFVREVLFLVMRICPAITICITDRKANGRIYSKHAWLVNYFEEAGWTMVSHKIWCKSKGTNFFRLNFSHIMTWLVDSKVVKQVRPAGYGPDVFYSRAQKIEGFSHGMPVAVVRPFIENFVRKKDLVVDPFMGSGTTAVACLETGRQFVGSEIDRDIFRIAQRRIGAVKGSLLLKEA